MKPNTEINTKGLIKIAGCDDPDRIGDIIFVHGLDGDAINTWHPKGRRDLFWPEWIEEDLKVSGSKCGVWSLGYNASSLKWRGSTMPLADRAINILDQFSLDNVGARPVVFICHSLGGLLVKQALRAAEHIEAYRPLLQHTRGIVFLSTPHSGSDLANYFEYVGHALDLAGGFVLPFWLSWLPLSKLFRRTVTLEELKRNDPQLRDLNRWFKENVNRLQIKIKVYYETEKTFGLFVVTPDSADPGLTGVYPVPADEEDHLSISKPPEKNHVYRGVERFIRERFHQFEQPDAQPALPQSSIENLLSPENISRLNQQQMIGASGTAPINIFNVNINSPMMGDALADAVKELEEKISAQVRTELAATLGILAEEFSEQENYPQAESVLTASLTKNPDNIDHLFQRGFVRFHMQNYQEASTDFSRVIEGGRDDADTFSLRGITRLAVGDYQGAESDITRALAENASAVLLRMRGVARMFQNKLSNAEDDLTAALALDPNNARLLLMRGHIRLLQEKSEEALMDLSDSIELSRTHFFSFLLRGLLHYQSKQWEPADADFTDALALNERSAYVYLMRGLIRLAQEKLPEAEADFTAAIKNWEHDYFVQLLVRGVDAVESDSTTEMSQWFQEHPESAQQLSAQSDLGTDTLATFFKDGMKLTYGKINPEAMDILRHLRAVPYINRGIARHLQRNFEEAEHDFEYAIELGVNTAGALRFLVQSKIEQQKLDDAELVLTKFLSTNSEAEALALRGLVRFLKGDLEHAEADLLEAIKLDAKDFRAYKLLGQVRLKYGIDRYPQVENDLTSALSINKDDGQAYYLRGAVRFDLERYEEAIDDLNAAEQLDVQIPHLSYLRAWAQFRLSNFKEALVDFNVALNGDALVDQIHYGIGAAQYSLGELQEAEKNYSLAIEHGMNDPSVYFERGLVRFDGHLFEEAEADFRKALSMDFKHPGLLYYFGNSLARQEKYDEALGVFNKAIEDAGIQAGNIYSGRGWAHFHLKNYAAAEIDLGKAIELGEETSFVYFRRALVRFEMANYAESTNDFEAAVDKNTGPASIFESMGAYLFAVGKYDVAETAFSRAIEAGFASSYPLRARTRIRQNNLTAAQQDCSHDQAADSEEPGPSICRADLFVANGDYDRAIAEYEALLAEDASRDASCAAGLAYLLVGDIEASGRAYDAGLEVPLDYILLAFARTELDFWLARNEDQLTEEIRSAAKDTRLRLTGLIDEHVRSTREALLQSE